MAAVAALRRRVIPTFAMDKAFDEPERQYQHEEQNEPGRSGNEQQRA